MASHDNPIALQRAAVEKKMHLLPAKDFAHVKLFDLEREHLIQRIVELEYQNQRLSNLFFEAQNKLAKTQHELCIFKEEFVKYAEKLGRSRRYSMSSDSSDFDAKSDRISHARHRDRRHRDKRDKKSKKSSHGRLTPPTRDRGEDSAHPPPMAIHAGGAHGLPEKDRTGDVHVKSDPSSSADTVTPVSSPRTSGSEPGESPDHSNEDVSMMESSKEEGLAPMTFEETIAWVLATDDPQDVEAFCCTFEWVKTAKELLDDFADRCKNANDEEKLSMLQVVSTLISSNPEACIKHKRAVEAFLSIPHLAEDAMKSRVNEMQSLLYAKEAELQGLAGAMACATVIGGDEITDPLKIAPKDFAEQMALFDMEAFLKISPKDAVRLDPKNPVSAIGLFQFLLREKQITSWMTKHVKRSMGDADVMSALLERMLQTAELSHNIGNFNGTFLIMNSLTKALGSKLPEMIQSSGDVTLLAWEGMESKALPLSLLYARLSKLTDVKRGAGSLYYDRLSILTTAGRSRIPYIKLIIEKLLRIKRPLLAVRAPEDIKFHAKVARGQLDVIKEIQQCQKTLSYSSIAVVTPVIDYLQKKVFVS